MAKYSVVHACGHSSPEHIVLYGKMTERERRLEWEATRPCLTCRRAKVTTDAVAHAETNALPPLIGSEEQVRYATDLRYRSLVMVDAVAVALDVDRDNPMPVPAADAFAEGEAITLNELVAMLHAEPSAHWWIEHGGRISRVRARPMMLNDEITDEEFVRDLLRATVGLRPTATLAAKVDQLNAGVLPANSVGNAMPIRVDDDPDRPVSVPIITHREQPPTPPEGAQP